LYFVLHQGAGIDVGQPRGIEGIGNSVALQLYRSLASVGQYLVPFILLAGGAVSFFRRVKRRGLLEQQLHVDTIRSLSWREFELLVGEAFRRQGYSVTETGGGGADGGVDLRLTKGSETLLVQCKQWKAFKVGVKVARELFGVVAAEGATGGIVVTAGQFTRDAVGFAQDKNINLLDGSRLRAMIGDVQKDPLATALSWPVADAGAPDRRQTPTPETVPTCPQCGESMVKRTARRGARAGQQFWGCSRFPRCRGTIGID
jgi:restriction system protein